MSKHSQLGYQVRCAYQTESELAFQWYDKCLLVQIVIDCPIQTDGKGIQCS